MRRGGMAQLTLKTGFDVDYYLDQVGANYYLSATGEPTGIWMGTGAESMRGPPAPTSSRGASGRGVGRTSRSSPSIR
jgi:hypothetical protein